VTYITIVVNVFSISTSGDGSIGRNALVHGVDSQNASTYTLRLARALSEQGWNVAASQPASASKVWIEANAVLESIPVRLSRIVFEVICDPQGFQ